MNLQKIEQGNVMYTVVSEIDLLQLISKRDKEKSLYL
jgi:hypothetical protein